MPQPSIARDFFESIVKGDAIAAIRRLINSTPPTVERDWLDFKTEPSDLKQRDRKIREVWSEALAGFANNEGGVLIWGVDARKIEYHGSKVDAACGEKPMTDPISLRSQLIELQRGATDPPLGNVEIAAYELPGSPGKGFVVCYVPEGAFKPYRAEQADHHYYIRAGDNFVVMSRSMLQTMFYPRSRAVFRARADMQWHLLEKRDTGGKDVARMTCSVELINNGTATARNTLVLVTDLVQYIHPPTFTCDGWVAHRASLGRELESTRPMHPGRCTRLFYMEWQVEARAALARDYEVVPFCQDPTFMLGVLCENQEPQTIKLQFDMNELITSRRCLREATPIE